MENLTRPSDGPEGQLSSAIFREGALVGRFAIAPHRVRFAVRWQPRRRLFLSICDIRMATAADCCRSACRNRLANPQQPGQIPNIAEVIQALHYIYHTKGLVLSKHALG